MSLAITGDTMIFLAAKKSMILSGGIVPRD